MKNMSNANGSVYSMVENCFFDPLSQDEKKNGNESTFFNTQLGSRFMVRQIEAKVQPLGLVFFSLIRA